MPMTSSRPSHRASYRVHPWHFGPIARTVDSLKRTARPLRFAMRTSLIAIGPRPTDQLVIVDEVDSDPVDEDE